MEGNPLIKRRKSVSLTMIFVVILLFSWACSPQAQEQDQGQIQEQEQQAKQWSTAPKMGIDTQAIYLATLKTEKGDIKVELFASKVPKTVNNFIFLVEEGFYDGTVFHRVLPNFMAQGGDPTGSGSGGPGYQFEDEFDPSLRFDGAGYLAMANSGPNTNGSQFFITYGPTPHLNGLHTIFGKVVEGMDVALSLTLRDPQQNPNFPGDTLLTVEIEKLGESLLPPPTPTPIPVVPTMEDGRPLAELAIAERENLYTGKPALMVDPSRSYLATIETTKGAIQLELRPDSAPESTNNFIVLADLGYYDGFPFVFVQPDEFVLTGSPSGQPDSDVGYGIPVEPELNNTVGAVGFFYRQDLMMASGSQFYILMKDIPEMDGRFSVFGFVTEGMDIVQQFTTEDRVEQITIIAR
jgi:cyclophilin family peptidyl-prolyl cis-trans isomerase